MKISLCFKDFVLMDSYSGNIGNSDKIGARQVFVRNDSSMMVAINLNAGSQRAENMRQISQTDMSLKNISKTRSHEQRNTLKKFGADSGGFDKIEKQSKPSHYSGYAMIGAGMLFFSGHLMSVEVYQNEKVNKKMSEKKLIDFASNFIRFNK
jgi:hypothetical protein